MTGTPTGIIVGGIDLVAGFVLILGSLFPLPGNWLALTLSVVLMFKAVFFLCGEQFNVPAYIDLAASAMLLAFYFGFYHSYFSVVGMLMLIKGAFAAMVGLTGPDI